LEHALFVRRYADIAARLARGADLAALTADLHAIYADEPPPHRALQALAFNQAMEQLGDDSERIVVPSLHRWLAALWPFATANYEVKRASPLP
jgi:hypothetical protein